MSYSLWVVPGRTQEVCLDGLVEGGRASLAPNSALWLELGGAAVWIDWETYPPEEHGWRSAEFERSVEHGAIAFAYRSPSWPDLFRVVERIATETRGAVYLDGALPWSVEDLRHLDDLVLGVEGNGVPYDRWPALAARILEVMAGG